MILPPFAKSAQLSLSLADNFILAMLSHISHTTLGDARLQVRPGKDNAKEEVDDDAARHARALTGRFQRFCSFADTFKEIQFLSEDTKPLKYLSSFCTFISKSDWAPHADQLVDMCDRQIIGLDLFKLARTLAACQHREGNLLREGETTIVFRLPRMCC